MRVRAKRSGYARIRLGILAGIILAAMPYLCAYADPSPIFLLGISRDGIQSFALASAAGERLSRVGENILIPPGLSKEERSCTQVSCLAALAKRLRGQLLVSGRVRTTGNRSSVELFVYDARTQRIATELASCNDCTDSALAAQVAALAGQLFDKNAPPRVAGPVAPVAPSAPSATPRLADASGPELQRLVAAVDGVRLQVERAAARAEIASTTVQQLKSTMDRNTERLDGTAATVQQLKSTADRNTERLDGTAATVQQLKLTVEKSAERTQGILDTVQQVRGTIDRLDKRVERTEASTTAVSQLKFALEKTTGGLESTQAAIAGVKDAAERAAAAAGQANERIGRVQLTSEELGKKLAILGDLRRAETVATGPAPLPPVPVALIVGPSSGETAAPATLGGASISPLEASVPEPAVRSSSPSGPLGNGHPPLALAAVPTASSVDRPQHRLSLRRKIIAGVFGGLAAVSLAATIVFFGLDGQIVAARCQNGTVACTYRFAPTYTTLGSVATGLFGAAVLGTVVYPTGDHS